jgi:hypothetical protein
MEDINLKKWNSDNDERRELKIKKYSSLQHDDIYNLITKKEQPNQRKTEVVNEDWDHENTIDRNDIIHNQINNNNCNLNEK